MGKDESMSKTDYIDNVRVYNDVTGTLAYFDDWAIANGYEKRMDMRTIMFENGSSEEEIDEEEEGLWNLFFDWCEKHNLTAMDE